MTATQSFATQGLVAQTEDQMEVGTSPYAQVDDIDFDLDDNREHSIEDNSMIDDTTETADPMQAEIGSTTQDDLMYDGEEHILEEDFSMDPENIKGLQEEDIEFLEDEVEQPQNFAEESSEHHSVVVAADQTSDHVPKIEQGIELQEEVTNPDNDIPDPIVHILSPKIESPKASVTIDTTNVPHPEDSTHIVDFAQQDSPKDNNKGETLLDPTNLKTFEEPSEIPQATGDEIEDNTKDINSSGKDIDEAAEDTNQNTEMGERRDSHGSLYRGSAGPHLHPVTVQYAGQDLSLFPPFDDDDSTTFLLMDASLAFEPVEKVLSACREVLGSESLGHDDEIVIDIPSLGLHICEDSKYASEITLAQVIDTYMLLSQNEQLSQIEPLYCQLSHRVCLQSQITYLMNSAHEGKTYSAILNEHADTPEDNPDLAEGIEEAVGDTTTYYDTAEDEDKLGYDANVTAAIEIEESVQDNGLDIEAAEAGNTPATSPSEEKQDTGPILERENHEQYELEYVQDDQIAASLAETHATPSYDGEGPEDSASHSSHTVEGDTVESSYQHNAEATKPEAEASLLNEPELDLEEDLFAEDDQTQDLQEDAAHNGTDAGLEDDGASNLDANEDELNFDDWDEEEETAVKDTKPATVASTPPKSINGKRKLAEDEDDVRPH